MRRHPLVLIVAVVACSAPTDPTPPAPATYRITPNQLWAGATVTVESEAFRTLGEGAELRLGLGSVPLVRVDDTTMTATIPSSAGGVYDPVVVMEDSLAPVDQVVVWGFAATRRYGPEGVWLPWDTYVWPSGEAQVIAGANTGEIAIIDLEAQATRTIPGVFYPTSGLRGPGATPEDSVFLLKPQGQPLQSWKFGEVPEKIGEHPEIGGNRQVLRLGLHSWLVTFSNRVEVWKRPDSSAAYAVAASYPLNEPQGVHLSPRKDRATLRGNWLGIATNQIPVFDVPSGDLAFHVPLPSTMGIDWSEDGDVLAVVGAAQPTAPEAPGTILLLNATTGVVLASATTELGVFAVALDGERPYVYVGVTTASGHLAVEVYSRANLTRLARLEVPENDLVCTLNLGGCHGGVLAVGINELHAFYGWNGLTRDSRFFLPAP
jgi:hypothetical protein